MKTSVSEKDQNHGSGNEQKPCHYTTIMNRLPTPRDISMYVMDNFIMITPSRPFFRSSA